MTDILYAARGGNAASDLYTIDPDTGSPTSVGASGFALTGLAIDPTSGIMYGATSNLSPSNPRSIVTVNLTTGAGTLVGSQGLASGFQLVDICFDTDGTLYGWTQDQKLASINTSTGAATVIGGNDPDDVLASGGGLDFVDGTLYSIPAAENLWTIDTSTGDATLVALVSPDLAGVLAAGSGHSGVLWGINSSGALGAQLITVDVATAVWTDIGTMNSSGKNFDALAWSADTPPPPPPGLTGRVFIAFDDGPLEPDPTWTVLDQAGDFPDQFVSGYDIESGRQTLISQTDTGTARVYINDHEQALFDPRNISSPYFGVLDGKQILLKLYDPEAEAWEDQFRGWIDDITWEIDGSAVGADGKPINASIQIECVDMFDFLAGYGLTPGLDGVTPQVVPSGSAGGPVPQGFEDGVYYAETTGTVDDRIIEILADVGIDPDRYLVASGNVSVKAVKYDPDESALQALRDAADAEFPFIANIYCDRHGAFAFRGRYSRFNPDEVAAEPGSTWDFTRWSAGDGAALVDDPSRAQIRTFAFGRNRSDLINVAIAYPQGMAASQMPNQVFANTASITAYGKHSAPPMSDLLVNEGSTTMSGFTTNDHQECFRYAKLLVLNQKDPRENITTLGLKAMTPTGSVRSQQTWALLTRADISHIVNVAVGYPAGTGLSGASPEDDYYIEGRTMRVRPANPTHDYVELDLAVSPAVWSMDQTGVFPAFASSGEPVLNADFTVAE